MTHDADRLSGSGSMTGTAPPPPACPGSLLLGNAGSVLRDPAQFLTDAYERCDPIFTLRVAWRRYTVIAGPAAADFMARGLDEAWLSRHRIFDPVQAELGRADLVLGQSGLRHTRLRPVLASAFSRQVVSPFVPALIEVVRRHVQRWPSEESLGVTDQATEMAFMQFREMLGPCGRRLTYRDARLLTDIGMNVGAGVLPALAFRIPWYRAAHRRAYEAVRDLVRAARRKVAAGTVIIREGDPADAFFLIEHGRVTVSRGSGAAMQQLAELGEGDCFGEAGLLQNLPRNATVTAGPGGAELRVLQREAFLGIVAASELVAAEVGRLLRRRVATNRLRQAVPHLTGDAVARVLPDFEWRTFDAGHTIIRRGDAAEHFFVVVEGEVEVARPGPSGAEAVVAHLGPGEYFGELGLLHGTPRNATVTAALTGPVKVLAADRAGFERLLTEGGGAHGELAGAMLTRASRLPHVDHADLREEG